MTQPIQSNIESRATFQIHTMVLASWVRQQNWFEWTAKEAEQKIMVEVKDRYRNYTDDDYKFLTLGTMKLVAGL